MSFAGQLGWAAEGAGDLQRKWHLLDLTHEVKPCLGYLSPLCVGENGYHRAEFVHPLLSLPS